MTPPRIIRVAVDTPLYRYFDYIAPDEWPNEALIPGVLLAVPFRHQTVTGVLIETPSHSECSPNKLKTALALLDVRLALPPKLLALLQWASEYYQYPAGAVIVGTLPAHLRQQKINWPEQTVWRLTNLHQTQPLPSRAHQQQKVIHLLQECPQGLSTLLLNQQSIPTQLLHVLAEKGYIQKTTEMLSPAVAGIAYHPAHPLNPEQEKAVNTIGKSLGQFRSFLLDGITGSGKTEVYLQCLETILNAGKQALILVPEIGLTPQTVHRFQSRFPVPITLLHSGLTDRERCEGWMQSALGNARIIIGTRSAIFTPLPHLGIIIVDEAHDASFKQQEGFRYWARDVAVMRASMEQVPVVLGSATPSFESLRHAHAGNYHHLKLTLRAANALLPTYHIVDIRRQSLNAGLSTPLIETIQTHVNQGDQILIFLNRRGYAPSLICHSCGWICGCKHCDARMTLHKKPAHLRCHHCNTTQSIPAKCPQCQSNQLQSQGIGTERLETALTQLFPNVGITRIDRDNTRRKGSMETLLDDIHTGKSQILIGTQMIAKGHHFPGLTLVAVVDADSGFFSSDFRASEHMAQLLTQVAGRSGRAEKRGTVMIQTRNPDHPLLTKLTYQGYSHFAKEALQERQLAGLPPFGHLALIRAEGAVSTEPLAFLDLIRQKTESFLPPEVALWGPIPSPMERRAGIFRAQLMLQTTQRPKLQTFLPRLLEEINQLKAAKKICWSLDVDPLEMF